MRARNVRRLLASLAVLILASGCTAGASPVPSPTSTPGPTAIATTIETPVATPAASSPTGLSVGREIHTATLLADGRALVAGGFGGTDASLASDASFASADLFDPKTDRFSPTGSMATARGFHTATLLANGRVLIAGGTSKTWHTDGPFLASAELYDPSTGTFSSTGSMAAAREQHTATVLADGRVLIAGGNDTLITAVASAELYDPKAGTFGATGSMTTARAGHTATLLADGRVLITGGHPAGLSGMGDGPYLASAELYDPKKGTFIATGSLTTARAWHTATLLADGRVLITGGTHTFVPSLRSAEIYDPKTGKFSATGSMADGRMFQTATLLGDGRVLVVGGCPHGPNFDPGNFLALAEIYDPHAGTFSPTGSMASARAFQGATLLADGRVLVTGGEGDDRFVTPLASAEIYDPTAGTFSPAG
jgi:Galactose oxidase, central domain